MVNLRLHQQCVSSQIIHLEPLEGYVVDKADPGKSTRFRLGCRKNNLLLFNAIFLLLLLLNGVNAFSQQGVSINSSGNPADTSAMLDVSGTDKGVLINRMNTAQMNAIISPANGLLIFNTDCNSFYYNNGTPVSPKWVVISTANTMGTPGNISGLTTVCANQTVVTYSIAAVNGANSYDWTVPTGSYITSGYGTTSITVDFGINSGNVCVAAVNGCGTSITSCMAVTVSGVLAPGTISSDKSVVCSSGIPAVFSFTTAPTGGKGVFSYQWYNSSGSLGSSATNSVYAPSGGSSAGVVSTESFDGVTFPPAGWSTTAMIDPFCQFYVNPPLSCPFNWERLTSELSYGGLVNYGLTQLPHSGAGEAEYDCWDAPNSDEAVLVSPSFSLAYNTSGAPVSFWMYSQNAQASNDLINVWYSTSPTQPTSTSGAVLLGTVNCYNSDPNGWYQHTYIIPGSVSSSTVWLIFDVVSAYGMEIYIDDVSWTSFSANSSSSDYYCKVSNECSSANTNSVNVTVNGPPKASITPASITICAGQKTTLTADGGGTYLWSNGLTTQAITVRYATTYNVIVTNAEGCTATASAIVNVNAGNPEQPVAGTSTSGQSEIVWNWNKTSGATGYKWNTTNDFNSATDVGLNTSYTQKGLTCNTPYTLYVWAYNVCGNSAAITLNQSTSSTCFACGSPFVDVRDHETYSTVQIGSQCWMAQNLNYGIFVTVGTGDTTVLTQKYCYDDLITNCGTYGGLYEWGEMMDGITLNNTNAVGASCNGTAPPSDYNTECSAKVQGICPSGWHVPAYYEWILLLQNAGTNPTDFLYNLVNQTVTSDAVTNILSGGSSGFNMLLGGRCGGGSPGSFSFGPGSAAPMGAFWSSTGYNAGNGYLYAMSPLFWPAYMPGQAYLTGSGAVGGLVAGSKAVGGFGYSVRCVKD